MSTVNVAISMDYFSQYNQLPKEIQKKAMNFFYKFKENPQNPGINFEKINNPYDDKFFSGRIDKTYRAIFAYQETSGTYIFLWVDHHDEAYQWARTKKIEVNKITGVLQLFDIPTGVVSRPDIINKIFDKYTDEQLKAISVPEQQLPFIRSLVTESDFIENRHSFSDDVAEYLDSLLKGENYNDVLKLVRELSSENKDGSFAEAIFSPSNRSFTTVEGQKELEDMFFTPLERWRVFLHPNQRRLVNKDFSGPYRVSGEAGTGKTVVAMHRAKYLLSHHKKVLFTTFTANLVGDIETNVMKLLSLQETKRLDIMSVDSVIISYLASKGKEKHIIYDENQLLEYWDNAIRNASVDLELDSSFYREEWRKVATPLDTLSIEKYISVPRIGRGIRLDRSQRLKVWHVFEEYMSLINKDQVMDIDYATYEARALLKANPEAPYDSIIIDEGQDISTNAYKFFRQYAGEEHQNDLFIVGDAHQRIYKNKAVLSKCGINIKGRSSLLRINYRTTEETRKYAVSVLNGINFDDADTEYTSLTKCQSYTHGDAPLVKNFENIHDQFVFVSKEIQRLHDSGIHYEDICVVARTHKQIDLAKSDLLQNGVPCYEINSNSKDNSSESGIRLATMHRVKGLEFRYVFAISVNKDIIPMLSHHVDEMDDNENNIIERCLLYVSLTRAQIKAYVLSYGTPSNFIEDQKVEK